ncbi:ABC transporter permease [Mycobacterium sp. MYCO198283]|uniref:ABC transporter permease n=1 Tax=Mycobacterium sp. MYCO198283 TaxID=2883505 RepID=UPI001E2E498E|nr:ABC transporter permease [Mycobacterium sp. MYCO198283]MCG5432369.1 ABC transporter permease [Mycobacterium sp. MYCO198283]
MTALAALTGRSLTGTLRDGDLLFALVGPVAFFLCFTITLRNVISTGAMSYPQYILPVIVVQAMIFCAMTTADRAARDHLSGMGTRLRALPVSPLAPVAARMLSALCRAVIGLLAALAVGHAFGFRFAGAPGDALAFVGIALLLSLALSLGADALGSLATSAEAASQALLVPQLLLVMLSTGIAPAEAFPSWLGPFVRNQPVSQIAQALRDLAGGTVATDTLLISLAWCVGMLAVFGAIAVRVQRRPA